MGTCFPYCPIPGDSHTWLHLHHPVRQARYLMGAVEPGQGNALFWRRAIVSTISQYNVGSYVEFDEILVWPHASSSVCDMVQNSLVVRIVWNDQNRRICQFCQIVKICLKFRNLVELFRFGWNSEIWFKFRKLVKIRHCNGFLWFGIPYSGGYSKDLEVIYGLE